MKLVTAVRGSAIAKNLRGGVMMAVNREELIECLNDLIETCHDGENGFRTAAEHVKDPELRNILERQYQFINYAISFSQNDGIVFDCVDHT